MQLETKRCALLLYHLRLDDVNWLVCGLAAGPTLVLYDGSPFHSGPEVFWKLAEQVGITIFGINAKYITALDEAKHEPRKECNLEKLRMICSTGSPRVGCRRAVHRRGGQCRSQC